MRQLELKDIQSYPIGGNIGLKCDVHFTSREGKEISYRNKTIVGISYEGYKDYLYSVIVRIGAGLHDVIYIKTDSIKPIFRPMTDLYKPCLEDGKIPIVELAKITGQFFIDYKVNGRYIEGIFTCGVKWYDYTDEHHYVFGWDEVHGFGLHNKESKKILFVPHQLDLFQKLYEWHFDVNNLIEQDLAVDINKVNI